ncbi:MAG: M1 family aminopeptidase, partial [Polyangiaceae bacterium]
MPRRGLPLGECFDIVIEYEGVPSALPELFGSGFLHTSDGAVIVGEPHVAATWFPANDHPSDRASFTFELTVPEGLEAVANGVLADRRSHDGWTTWVWEAAAPMATYLAGVAIGELELSEYEVDGIRYWDAVAERFVGPIARPSSGTHLLSSGEANLSYKRLGRVIAVPEQGAELSFSVTRQTEWYWDFFFVEAHTPGLDDWTTLPDAAGHATQDPGSSCPVSLALHPALAHYLTASAFRYEPCPPLGSSGEWWAATGESEGVERWTIDLSPYAGQEVEVSLSYVSDDIVQGLGVFIDDVVVSTGEGSSSFEDDGLDGWVVLGPPEGSRSNTNDWSVVGAADVPLNPQAQAIGESLARQPEIIAFLEQLFGPYPFDAAGAIIPNAALGFALENQTRPIYSSAFFYDVASGSSVLVHELTHQWFGDSLSVSAWQHIWLNEGFATYAEWLWAEHEGLGTVDEAFEGW